MNKENIEAILKKYRTPELFIPVISGEILALSTMTEEEIKAEKIAEIEAQKATYQAKIDALEVEKATLTKVAVLEEKIIP